MNKSGQIIMKYVTQDLLVNVSSALCDFSHEDDHLGLGQLKVVGGHLLEQLAPAQQLSQDDLKCTNSSTLICIVFSIRGCTKLFLAATQSL